ncbi:MAG: hypothetical protein GY871_04125 [Actinomycetales bacterium]|nr:hypothetical protein [Actinomycetales bacterium]
MSSWTESKAKAAVEERDGDLKPVIDALRVELEAANRVLKWQERRISRLEGLDNSQELVGPPAPPARLPEYR